MGLDTECQILSWWRLNCGGHSWIFGEILNFPDLSVFFVYNSQLHSPRITQWRISSTWAWLVGPRGPWDSAIWGSAQPEKDTTSNLEVNRRDDSAYWWSMGGGLVISGGSGRKFGTKMEHCIWKCTRNTCNSGAEKHVNAGEQRSFPATLSSGPPPWWGLLPTVPPLLSPAQWEGESHRPCLGPWICAPATLLHFLVTFSYFHS